MLLSVMIASGVVSKVVASAERLSPGWMVHSTTFGQSASGVSSGGVVSNRVAMLAAVSDEPADSSTTTCSTGARLSAKPAGIERTAPTDSSDGSEMPLSIEIASTVVPYSSARPQRLSPSTTVTWVVSAQA